MKVLIIGDLGFVGTETKQKLNGHDEYVGFDLMDGYDIRNKGQLEEFIIVNKPDRILHLAAIARFPEADADPIRAFETNALGTKNIAELAEKYQIPLVHASTGSVYMPIKLEPPITEDFPIMGNSVYGCTKAVGELYVRKIKTPWIVLRYSHLYGREKRMEGLIGNFVRRIKSHLEPVMYGGKQSNDFCYIKDVAQANYLALNASFDKWYQCYNIGSGEEITTEKAAELICKELGYQGNILKKEERTVDPKRFVYNITKAKEMLKFKPEYNFEKGLGDMKL